MDLNTVNRKEIFRYLGYRNHPADERTEKLVEECLKLLEKESAPAHRSLVFPLVLEGNGNIDGGCFHTKSRNLEKNLKDCDQIMVFAATLGTGADYLIHRYNRIEMSRAVIFQAAAAAMIEAYCNELCRKWKEEYEAEGWYVRPRFSPGYGDFSLECQKDLLGALEAGKYTGIHLTDSLLMVPSKSVTAVMGMSRMPGDCEIGGCEACEKKDCLYRR